jgi:hypothetical protein
MSKIKVIGGRGDKNKVNIILDETKEMDFDEIIVFGYKHNKIHTKSSGIDDSMRTVGALEYAKHQLLRD